MLEGMQMICEKMSDKPSNKNQAEVGELRKNIGEIKKKNASFHLKGTGNEQKLQNLDEKMK